MTLLVILKTLSKDPFLNRSPRLEFPNGLPNPFPNGFPYPFPNEFPKTFPNKSPRLKFRN